MKIAIDGPSGSGKSTIAKRAAEEMSFVYVDTGAMYRAMAFYFLNKKTDIADEAAVSKECASVSIDLQYEQGLQQVYLNDKNVSSEIRNEEVGKAASAIARYGEVRKKLVELQRKLADKTDVVMDGRDIGTIVLPNADKKIYLTASSEVRAKRRYKELREKCVDCDLEQIKRDIIKRDAQDTSRKVSPLRQAEDAVYIDSSELTLEEVTEKIIDIIRN